jgi:type IV pilus biogenesis protein CpaD/CtpE
MAIGPARVTFPSGTVQSVTLLDAHPEVGSNLLALGVEEDKWRVVEVHPSPNPEFVYDITVEAA